jgi:hypothetical protein
MSLRARILALLLGLGLIPILFLGIIGYGQSMNAVRRLLAVQASTVAHRAAVGITNLYELRLSELLLLTENAETQRLCAARSGRDSLSADSALSRATAYFSDAWALSGAYYRRIDLLDSDGRLVLSLGAGGAAGLPPIAASAEARELSPDGRSIAIESEMPRGGPIRRVDLGDVIRRRAASG